MKNIDYIQNVNSIILSEMVGFGFKVYQGQKFILVTVNENMVGFKFGEFIRSRKLHVYKKNK